MKRVLCLLLVIVMLASIGVQAFAEETMFCRLCGKQIPADSKVCTYCGEAVVLVEQTANVKTALNGDTGAAVSADVKSAPSGTQSAITVTRISAPSPATAEAATPGPFNTTAGSTGALGKVRVTKSPTSESVPYGGSCLFIAHAVNATSVTWYISNADGSIITTAAEAPSRVSGLSVSGANSDTLSLSGIPSWMNGCKVQACFTGEGGPVYSEIAYIWTYEEANTYKGCSWWDWFKYYYRYDPYYWDDPWYWYSYWTKNPHAAPAWFKPEKQTKPATVIHTGHYNPLDDDEFDYVPVKPAPKPEPQPSLPKPGPEGVVVEEWVEENLTPSFPTVVLSGKDDDYDVIVIEKDNNDALDQAYLDRLWEANHPQTGGGSDEGVQNAAQNETEEEIEEEIMTSEWVE